MSKSVLYSHKRQDLIYCISFGKVSNLASHGTAHTKLRQHACTFILFYKNQPVTQTKSQKRKMNRCLYLYIFFTLLIVILALLLIVVILALAPPSIWRLYRHRQCSNDLMYVTVMFRWCFVLYY